MQFFLLKNFDAFPQGLMRSIEYCIHSKVPPLRKQEIETQVHENEKKYMIAERKLVRKVLGYQPQLYTLHNPKHCGIRLWSGIY